MMHVRVTVVPLPASRPGAGEVKLRGTETYAALVRGRARLR